MILDTTVLVDLLRGEPKARDLVASLEAEGRVLWVPTPAVFEVYEGIERADRPDRELRAVREVLDAYTVLPFETDHAVRAGRVSGELVRRGAMIDPVDAQIAGSALAMDRPVLTRNAKHFERVDGLAVEKY
ncbi:MAG: PIN domain-containing protein [Methanobacteriota archaeon]